MIGTTGEATAMQCWAGVMRPDFAQIGSPLAQFVGGWGGFAPLKMGAKIISTGGVDSERQLMLMRELGTSAFVSTPSFFFICVMLLEIDTTPRRH